MVVILLFSVFSIVLIVSIPAFSKPGQTRPCTDCHGYPATQINVTTNTTSVTIAPGGNFSVTASYTGGANDGKATSQIAWPDEAANNTLFGFDPQYSVASTSPIDSLTSTITAPTTTGTYTIRVYAASGSWDGIAKETDYENITVTVRILGDVNGDGVVDGSDLTRLSKAYGSELGDSKWDEDCDFNRDDKVDASDLFDLGKNYGKSA